MNFEALELEAGNGDVGAGGPEEEYGDGEEKDDGDADEEVPAAPVEDGTRARVTW